MLPAIIAGFQAAAGTGTGLINAKMQADATREAAQRSAEAGALGAQEIYDAGQRSQDYARQGQLEALAQYELARQYAEAQRSQLGQYYDQARQVGGSALQRYQDAMLRGQQGAVYSDPAFGFRQAQASTAAGELAARAGLDPALMQQGDWARYNQQLADQEYSNALNRLQGLGGLGTAATSAYAGADMATLETINRARGATAAEQLGGNQYRAQLAQNAAGAYGNALTGNASNVANYEIQRANALAMGAANVNNALQNAGQSLLFYYMANRPQQAAAAAQYDPYLQPTTSARPAPDYYGA
jgi:hypothetical protein